MHQNAEKNAPENEDTSKKKPEWKTIFRGVWADHLENGDLLPVGGSMFSNELTIRLTLDFETFDPDLEKINLGYFKTLFEERRTALTEWLEQVAPKEKIDPFLFFACTILQKKMETLLAVTGEERDDLERRALYGKKEEPPALSELRGKTMCAERAALMQHLLQRIGVESAYVSGTTMHDARDPEEFPDQHSFIVIRDSLDASMTYVYDVARPRSQGRLPRLLKTDVPLTPELFEGKQELYVRAKEVLQGGTLWFGVGEPVAGEHDVLEIKET